MLLNNKQKVTLKPLLWIIKLNLLSKTNNKQWIIWKISLPTAMASVFLGIEGDSELHEKAISCTSLVALVPALPRGNTHCAKCVSPIIYISIIFHYTPFCAIYSLSLPPPPFECVEVHT